MISRQDVGISLLFLVPLGVTLIAACSTQLAPAPSFQQNLRIKDTTGEDTTGEEDAEGEDTGGVGDVCDDSTNPCDNALSCCPNDNGAGSTCRDLSSDVNNCGDCSNVCGVGLTCNSGTCGLPAGKCAKGDFVPSAAQSTCAATQFCNLTDCAPVDGATWKVCNCANLPTDSSMNVSYCGVNQRVRTFPAGTSTSYRVTNNACTANFVCDYKSASCVTANTELVGLDEGSSTEVNTQYCPCKGPALPGLPDGQCMTVATAAQGWPGPEYPGYVAIDNCPVGYTCATDDQSCVPNNYGTYGGVTCNCVQQPSDPQVAAIFQANLAGLMSPGFATRQTAVRATVSAIKNYVASFPASLQANALSLAIAWLNAVSQLNGTYGQDTDLSTVQIPAIIHGLQPPPSP